MHSRSWCSIYGHYVGGYACDTPMRGLLIALSDRESVARLGKVGEYMYSHSREYIPEYSPTLAATLRMVVRAFTERSPPYKI